MYTVKAYTTGKFEIYNVKRKRVVFAGTDKSMKKKVGTTYEFASRDDLFKTICTWVSLATYRKIVKRLNP